VGNRVTENIVSQVLTEMSGLEDMHNVTVIAATNRPDMLDPAIMRPGRFDRQVLVPAPDAGAREEILKVHTKKMPLGKDISIKALAKETDGYSGADLEAVVREAGMNAMRDDMNSKTVKLKHFTAAIAEVRPSIDAAVIKHYQTLMDAMKARGTKEQSKRERDDVNYVG
jgi:transitional endoplasmic reticulum ATPase